MKKTVITKGVIKNIVRLLGHSITSVIGKTGEGNDETEKLENADDK